MLEPHRDRITWDANIHSVADIEGLPFAPRMVNVKPSRLGPLRELTAAYDFCAERGIGMYGGGQFEIGPGRGQIQYLASVFHPDTPNDVAPGGYNDADPPAGLPDEPARPAARADRVPLGRLGRSLGAVHVEGDQAEHAVALLAQRQLEVLGVDAVARRSYVSRPPAPA